MTTTADVAKMRERLLSVQRIDMTERIAASTMLADLVAERDRLREALRDVANPLDRLRRNAEAQGSRLSGAAYTIANDLNFVQGLARAALEGKQG